MSAIKTCIICGRDFPAKNRAKYCSEKCRRVGDARYQAEWRKRRGAALSLRARRLPECKCVWCGRAMTKDEIYYADEAEENWIFCSRECAMATFLDKFFAMKEAGIIKDGPEQNLKSLSKRGQIGRSEIEAGEFRSILKRIR